MKEPRGPPGSALQCV